MLLIYHICRLVLCSLCVGYLVQSVQPATSRVTAFGPDTHPSCLHLTPNQQQLENQTACVVTKRYSRKLLMLGIMVPDTC